MGYMVFVIKFAGNSNIVILEGFSKFEPQPFTNVYVFYLSAHLFQVEHMFLNLVFHWDTGTVCKVPRGNHAKRCEKKHRLILENDLYGRFATSM